MKVKLFIIFAFFSTSVHAQDKGFLFRLGETFMRLGGFSYNKLELKFQELETKVQKFETERTQCLNDALKMKGQLDDREKDIRDCIAYENFKASPIERGIGFTVIDVLKGGCTGTIKYNQEKFGSHRGPEGKAVTNLEGEIEIKPETRFGSQIGINLIKKTIGDDRRIGNPYQDRIEAYPFTDNSFQAKQWSPVVLGRMYEDKDERKGGTLEKGVFKARYNVMKTNNNQLEVIAEGEGAKQWNHMPTGEKYTYKLTATCKTLDELNAMATKGEPGSEEISKKVFGN